MNRGAALAEAASGFVGVAFRLHGRDPASGLDCVGLVAASLAACGCAPMVPVGYRLRNASIAGWIGCAARSELVPVDGPPQAGDVLLTCPGPGQHHLMIADTAASAIHAHAGLGRVVRQALPDRAQLRLAWRLTQSNKDI
jgi:cell wall-associated NlpC family hydrolase